VKSIADLHFRVCDHGLFLPVARRLAREARRVSYWTPSEKAFATVRDRIGDGFPDIERVNCYLEDLDSVDCFVFPDIGFSEIQLDLEARGIPVWGARAGDELERNRGKFLDELERVGLPVPKHERIKGISALRAYLADKKDLWIKIDEYRGDWETFHWRSYEEDDNALDAYATYFGPFREEIIFYVFDPIDGNEDGCDTWSVDGQFPDFVIHGMESKDKAYIGTFQRFADLPEELRRVNEAFAEILRSYGYKSFFSIEVRIPEQGESKFNDATCRAGSPPSQAMTEMIANYAEIVWEGAHGRMVNPRDAAKFGVQAIVSADRGPDYWTTVKADDELDRWLKCGTCLRRRGHLWFPPNKDSTSQDVGWLVGVGDTMAEAIKHLKHNAGLLPAGAKCEFDSLAELIGEITRAEEEGREFTDQPVPEPTIILEET
jgi:hypothetical protein